MPSYIDASSKDINENTLLKNTFNLISADTSKVTQVQPDVSQIHRPHDEKLEKSPIRGKSPRKIGHNNISPNKTLVKKSPMQIV